MGRASRGFQRDGASVGHPGSQASPLPQLVAGTLLWSALCALPRASRGPWQPGLLIPGQLGCLGCDKALFGLLRGLPRAEDGTRTREDKHLVPHILPGDVASLDVLGPRAQPRGGCGGRPFQGLSR